MQGTSVFYIGTNNVDELTEIRRHILGTSRTCRSPGNTSIARLRHRREVRQGHLPADSRAWHRRGLPTFFALKSRFDEFAERLGFLPSDLSDRVLRRRAGCSRSHLPRRMKDFRDRYEHHLLLQVSGDGIAEARGFLEGFFGRRGWLLRVHSEEGKRSLPASLRRCRRRRALPRSPSPEVEDIVALDIALRRNDQDWFETLPADLEDAIVQKLYYGHFFCHVFHQDYVCGRAMIAWPWSIACGPCSTSARRNTRPSTMSATCIPQSRQCRASSVALDPCNALNPGIGQTVEMQALAPGEFTSLGGSRAVRCPSYSASGNTGDGGAGRSTRAV